MKPQNVFAYKMCVDWPVFREFLIVCFETNSGEIGGQRIEPHVEDVARIIRKRNAPLQRHAADREVLQTRLHERYDFIPPALGPDEGRVLVV